MLLGISVLFVLKDGPEKAEWLEPQEKVWLAGELERDRSLYGAGEHGRLMDVFKMPAVWILAAVYVIIQIGVYIVNLWMPLILVEPCRWWGGAGCQFDCSVCDGAVRAGRYLHGG